MNIQEEDMTYAKATLGNDNFSTDTEEQKVLGLSWNFHNDEFVIKLTSLAQLAGELSLTKRNILRVIAKVFEPLGLISPVVIEMKVLFQEL